VEKVVYLLVSYNHAEHVVDALETAFSQSLKDLLIVICDDGSNDGTQELIVEFLKTAGKTRRVQTIFNTKNLGFPAFLNEIHKEIHAEYFVYASADDLASRNKAEASLRLMSETGASAVVCNVSYLDEDGVPIGGNIFALPSAPFLCHRQNNLPYHLVALSGQLLKRVLPLPEGTYAEDQLFLRLAFMCKSFGVAATTQNLVRYRITDTSITGKLNKKGLSHFRRRLWVSAETNKHILNALSSFNHDELIGCVEKSIRPLEAHRVAALNCERNFGSRMLALLMISKNFRFLSLKQYIKLAGLLIFSTKLYYRLTLIYRR
jgi:glycosyltransferase involved in cell wall biosynthesis